MRQRDRDGVEAAGLQARSATAEAPRRAHDCASEPSRTQTPPKSPKASANFWKLGPKYTIADGNRLGVRSSWAGQRAIQLRALRPPRALAMVSAVITSAATVRPIR